MVFIEADMVSKFLLAIVLLLGSTYFFGCLFEHYKMPKVIGEIIGGLILGPSLMGTLAPNAYAYLFNSFQYEGQVLSVFYWMGLILLMFVSGLEQQRWDKTLDQKLIISLIVTSTMLPIFLGYLMTNIIDLKQIVGTEENYLALKIIFAISMAITSIPVISKIFMDLSLIKTNLAKTILSIAIVHDVILWVGVAIAQALVSSKVNEVLVEGIACDIAAVVLLFLVSLTILPKLITKLSNLKVRKLSNYSPIGCAILYCLTFIIVSDYLNVSVMFGALLAGMVLGISFQDKMENIKNNIKNFSMAFFIPIYFALVGIKIDLIKDFSLTYIVIVFVGSILFQTLAVMPVVMVLKKNLKLAITIILSLNAKGGPGIVLATVAFDAGIINSVFFTTLIIVTILSSLLAGWWLRVNVDVVPTLL